MKRLDKISPDTISYNAAIAACGKAGMVEEGMKLVERMKTEGKMLVPIVVVVVVVVVVVMKK